MDKKNRIVLTVLASLTLVIALIGATFAYFSAVSQSEPQVITTSSLNLSVAINGSTHITNIKPTTWSSDLSQNDVNVDIVRIPFTVSSSSRLNGNYNINMTTQIPSNSQLSGGSASDVKYKLFKNGETTPLKEGSLSSDFNEDIITMAPITADSTLNDTYILYVYIENKNEAQNTLQNIDFSIILNGSADQTD